MISVVISYYKNIPNLELVLMGLSRQSFKDFEVVVAEDDNATETIDFLEKVRNVYTFPILHVSQEDKGFRKCKILNSAIKVANGEKIVFLDGDCIPHRKFLYWYDKLIVEGRFLTGRRVMLSEKLSNKILKTKKLNLLKFINFVIYGCKPLRRALYLPFMPPPNRTFLLGCNMGGTIKNLLKVNGFDEDYQLVGVGEDHDLEWRLRTIQVDIVNIRYNSLTYHLYHKLRYVTGSLEDENNRKHLVSKTFEGQIFCKNGLNKIDNL